MRIILHFASCNLGKEHAFGGAWPLINIYCALGSIKSGCLNKVLLSPTAASKRWHLTQFIKKARAFSQVGAGRLKDWARKTGCCTTVPALKEDEPLVAALRLRFLPLSLLIVCSFIIF